MSKPTAEQLLRRWEIRREVQNIMGKYSLHFCIKQEGELFQYWSCRDDVCLGVNNGWFEGRAALKGYYDSLKAETALASRLIKARFPDKLEDKTDEECFGVGQMAYRPIDTGVIEVAEDLKSAKGLWVCRGSYNRITAAGPVSYWDWSYWAVDFILEEGQWKIWHMQDLYEVNCEQGLNFTDEPKTAPVDPAFSEMDGLKPAMPNKPYALRAIYSANRAFTPSPRVPEPYITFTETFSYGIGGETA